MEQATVTITIKDMLLQHFAPAEAAKASMKSTTDLFRILDEHAPGKFVVNDLYDVLRAEGFKDQLVGDALMWLVAPR